MEKTLSFQLSANMYNTLQKIASENHRSKGYIMRDIVAQYLEDYIDIQYARKVSQEIAEGTSTLVDFGDVMKDLGLE